jgi:hypothetical protein
VSPTLLQQAGDFLESFVASDLPERPAARITGRDIGAEVEGTGCHAQCGD